jgi:hypothetical protein
MKESEGDANKRASEPPLCITSDEVNYLVYRYASGSLISCFWGKLIIVSAVLTHG